MTYILTPNQCTTFNRNSKNLTNRIYRPSDRRTEKYADHVGVHLINHNCVNATDGTERQTHKHQTVA